MPLFVDFSKICNILIAWYPANFNASFWFWYLNSWDCSSYSKFRFCFFKLWIFIMNIPAINPTIIIRKTKNSPAIVLKPIFCFIFTLNSTPVSFVAYCMLKSSKEVLLSSNFVFEMPKLADIVCVFSQLQRAAAL